MTVTVGTSGGNKAVSAITIGTSGGNKAVITGYIGTSGGNKVFYSAMSASASPTLLTGSTNIDGGTASTSGNATATPSGGVGPYTYAWEKVSGDTLTVSSPTSASTGFSGTVGSGGDLSAVYRCEVTDTGTGQTAYTNNVSIALLWIDVS